MENCFYSGVITRNEVGKMLKKKITSILKICAADNFGISTEQATGKDVNNFRLWPVDGWTHWVACAYSEAGKFLTL